MTVMVALLRGVNVGGHSKLAMSDLRDVISSCGYKDVRTYIQSGNAVFTTSTRSSSAVAEDLRAAIALRTSVNTEVIVRTRSELEKAVAGNPFLARGADPAQLHLVFTSERATLSGLDIPSYAPEAAIASGRHIYLLLPNGIGHSKLAADIARTKDATGTVRNWRTVTMLLEMMSKTV